MNGESPMMSPVTGSRSGASGSTVSSVITTSTASGREERVAKALRLRLRRHLGALVGVERRVVALERGVVRAEASLDDAHGDERHDDRDQDRRGDAEVQVRGEVDRALGVDERARVVRDLGQDAVERRDQEVDAEAGGDARERGRHPGERVAADALERSRTQGYQHEVPGVGGDAREDADEDDDRRQHRLRRDADELPDQRPDQAGGLGEADADHHHEDDRDRREVAEVGDERREEEADPVGREEALDRRRLRDDRRSRPPGPTRPGGRRRAAWNRPGRPPRRRPAAASRPGR